jgi:hypothetical protein
MTLLRHLQSSKTPRVKLLSNHLSRTPNEEYSITNTQNEAEHKGKMFAKKGENARSST